MSATSGSVGRGGGAWWRGRWMVLALMLFGLQIAGMWMISGRPELRLKPVRAPEVVAVFIPEDAGDPAFEAWRWLVTPSVYALPSAGDFSGLAWLRVVSQPMEFEAFAVPQRPLPWALVRGPGMAPQVVNRLDPGLAGLWEVPTVTASRGAVPPVALATRGRVRVVDGLEGRQLRGETWFEADPLPIADVVARPVVVRVMVDEWGDLAAPPVLWESSEVAAVDEAALRVVRGMRFTPGDPGRRSWGLLSIEWPLGGPKTSGGASKP